MTHAIVHLTSILDVHCIDRLRLEIGYLLDAGTQAILLDCCNIEFMNSSFLGVLVAISKEAKQQDSEIILCGLSLQAQRIIELTQLDKLFRIYSHRQEFEQTYTYAPSH